MNKYLASSKDQQGLTYKFVSNARLKWVFYFVRRMMCNPESVSTVPLISPTLRANAASVGLRNSKNEILEAGKNQYITVPSNGFCIWFLPKSPKSPPRLALEQSEYFSANSASVASPESIRSRYESRIFWAKCGR
jgi:hypothetical protein